MSESVRLRKPVKTRRFVLNRRHYAIVLAGLFGGALVVAGGLAVLWDLSIPYNRVRLLVAQYLLGTALVPLVLLATVARLRDVHASPLWALGLFVPPFTLPAVRRLVRAEAPVRVQIIAPFVPRAPLATTPAE